jgi:spore coat protein H
VFDERVHEYRIEVHPADLAKMNANPALYDELKIYVPAEVTIDGIAVGRVGVRYKGSWGTFRTCLPNPDGTGPAEPYHPIAANRCPPVAKFPYKISFDEFSPKKRFHGLAKLNLDNLIRDPSQLHERLASQLFRDMGIPAARSSFARVTVNGASKGLYAVTEDMGDARFTADRWPDDPHGNLYKQGWPRFLEERYWQGALATNRRADPPASHEKVIAFSREMTAANDPERAAAVLERWSDPEWLARYMAVDTAIRNVDGVTKLFCLPGDTSRCVPNNFYWYETRQGKFLLLPLDLDYTWRVRVRQNRLPPWDSPIPGPGLPDCNVRFPLYGAQHAPPACDPVFRGIAARRALYLEAVRKLLAHFDVNKLRADVDRLAALVKPVVIADPAIPAEGSRAWPTMVELLKHDIGVLRERMEAVAAGQPHRPFPPTPDWEPLPDSAPPVSAADRSSGSRSSN